MDLITLDPMPLTLDQQARERIRTWIRTSATTQTELAARIGRNQAWMSRYLKGEFDADLETLQKMAQAFDHTIFALLDLARDRQEQRILDVVRAAPIKSRAKLLDYLETVYQRPGHRHAPPETP